MSSKTMAIPPATSWNEIGAIVGADHMRPATPADAIDGVLPRYVIEPGDAEEVAHVLTVTTAAGICVAPRGGGTKMELGNSPRKVDVLLSTNRFNHVLEHAWGDMTSTVEAGCTVAHLQETLAEHGQHLAIDPLWPERATIGGVLATNDSGALRVRFGSLRDLIIGIKIVLPDGTIARSGGKVVKNVAGYDLPKLMTGALGTLGVIVEATFRLYPLPRESRTLSFKLPSVTVANDFMLAIQDSTLVPTGLQLRASATDEPYVDVRFEGTAAAIDAQTHALIQLVAAAEQINVKPGTWSAREYLWNGAASSIICKTSVLPTQLARLCEALNRVAVSSGVKWRAVMQSIGLGTLRIEADSEGSLLRSLESLRQEMKDFGGSLVVWHCPREMKAHVDVWDTNSDALPLMRRVKQMFDPTGTLNSGRFVGGI
jgi:glycolate oxidase FAD binding subunit